MQQRILELIGKVNGDPALVANATGASHLVNDLRIDSLNLVSLILMIESELDIEVPLEDLTSNHIEALDNFIQFIETAR
jgi:acyl carrier protein